MKKMKLFLTGMLAAVVAVGGVNAADTFETCVADANSTVCELSADYKLTKDLDVNRTLTINLKGHKLDFDGKRIKVLTNGNLTIEGENGTIEAAKVTDKKTRFLVTDGSSLTVDNVTITALESQPDSENIPVIGIAGENKNGATVVVGKGAVINSTDTAVSVDTASGKADVIANVNVEISGKIHTTDNLGVTVNGRVKEGAYASKIAITGDAEITSDKGPGIYAAGYGIWTLEDRAKVTGYDAISIKSGSLTINGGEYTATGTWKSNPDQNNSGAEMTGSAISITSNSNYAGDIRVTINGGKFTAKEGCALYEYTSEDGTKLVALKIADGEFVAGSKVGNIIALKKATLTKFIEGGTYSGTKANAKLTGNYVDGDMETVNGVNYVGEATETVHNVKVALVQPDGQTVNVAGAYRVAAGNKIVLTNLFGFTMNNYKDYTITYVVKNAEGLEIARVAASYLKGADNQYVAKLDDGFTMIDGDVTVEILFSKNGMIVAPDEPVIPDNEITTEIPSADDVVTTDEETSKVLTETLKNTEDEELKELLEENDVTVALEAKEVEVSEDEEKKFAEALPNATMSKYLDINVLVKAGTKTLNLHELDEEITLTVKIPEDLPEVKDGYTRVYYILREHDGKVEKLKTILSEDGTELSFATDKFSTYALAYEDQANAGTNPDTLDNIGSYLIISAIACTGLVALGYSIKKKLEN